MLIEFTKKNIPLPISLKDKKAFCKWADDNGWQPYDSLETWINLKKGRKLDWIDRLYDQYKEIYMRKQKV